MKIDFEELESPYFDGEVEFVAPAYELRQSLASVIDESPFTNLVGVSGTETSRIAHSGAEAPELETRDSDGPLAETWIEGETEYDAEERTYDDYVVEESDSSTRFEHALPRPATKKTEEVPQRRHILVVDDQDKPVAEGEYAFHQGNLIERGMLDATGGLAFFGRIDPPKPFVLEVRDRVCAILAGAFLNPDDPKIEYGGTWFDWTMVRDGKNPRQKLLAALPGRDEGRFRPTRRRTHSGSTSTSHDDQSRSLRCSWRKARRHLSGRTTRERAV